MRRAIPFLLCAILLLQSLPSSGVSAAGTPFPDMENAWFAYRDSVMFLRDREVIHGNPDGTFRPKDVINRAEFIKLVFAARGSTVPAGISTCFKDLDPEAWYGAYVCAANRRGMVDGYPDGTFRPSAPVNFAEALKIIAQAYHPEIPSARAGEDWYDPYADEFDRIDVFPRHTYVPWEPMTRERGADLIARIIRYDEDRLVPRLSPGCGRAAGTPPSSVLVRGTQRSFLLTVPSGYVANYPSPLIVAFHGRTNSNEQVRGYYGLDRNARDYFIAYPAAIKGANGSFTYADPGESGENMRDVAFFDALVQTLASRYCIDMDRIFVVGHSLGAWMANSVACIRGGVVRGSGTVGGDSVIMPCAGPTAGMLMHNPHDKLASFASTERAMNQRREDNECGWASQPVEPSLLKCREYDGCIPSSPVVWCPHELDMDPQGDYYPHNWPREATPAILRFFADLERPPGAPRPAVADPDDGSTSSFPRRTRTRFRDRGDE